MFVLISLVSDKMMSNFVELAKAQFFAIAQNDSHCLWLTSVGIGCGFATANTPLQTISACHAERNVVKRRISSLK